MPIYEFECSKCFNKFEKFVKDIRLSVCYLKLKCPKCNEAAYRIISLPHRKKTVYRPGVKIPAKIVNGKVVSELDYLLPKERIKKTKENYLKAMDVSKD